jgi:hypothetical protein
MKENKENKDFRIKENEYWLSECGEEFFVYDVDYEGKEVHVENNETGMTYAVGFEDTEEWTFIRELITTNYF